jgi:hypothetical protein
MTITYEDGLTSARIAAESVAQRVASRRVWSLQGPQAMATGCGHAGNGQHPKRP